MWNHSVRQKRAFCRNLGYSLVIQTKPRTQGRDIPGCVGCLGT